MKRNFLKFGSLFLMMSAVLVSGCIDQDKDLFDEDGAKKIYEEGFPVDNVDAGQDWKTTRSATVSVLVNEDEYTDYTVKLFTDNPLNSKSNAKLLASGYANEGTDYTFHTAVDYPSYLTQLYAARVDTRGRYSVKPVEVKNGNLNVTFGNAAKTRASGSVTITPPEEVGTVVTKQDVNNMIASAEELPKESWGEAYGTGKNNTTYILSKDLTISAGNFYWAGNVSNTTFIVTHKLTITGGFSFGAYNGNVHLIIANGGELTVTGGQFSLNGRLTVMDEGSLICQDFMPQGNYFFYNKGYMEVASLNIPSAGGTVYNDGTLICKTGTGNVSYQASNTATTFYNRGKAIIDKFDGGTVSSIQNGCYLEIKTTIKAYNIIVTDNGAIYCESTTDDGNASARLTMGSPSMFVCSNYYDVNRTIIGPTDGSALIKAQTIARPNGVWSGSYSISGNVIFDLPESAQSENSYPYLEGFIVNGGSTASICLPGQANFMMEASDCAGEGYEGTDPGTDPEPQEMAYTYVFEDNYPNVGDYDFNDVVLDVVPVYNRDASNKIETIDLKITLTAVGATKKLGAGLRLAKLNASYISSVSFSGDVNQFKGTLANSVFANADTEINGTEMVIPLFGDAHQVYGMSERKMINTGLTGSNGGTSETYTMIVTLTPIAQSTEPLIQQENLDFFIAYQEKNTRTEVHLYEFRNYGATANGNVHEDNLAAAGNLTWALCIPNFRFPIEACKINIAYPQFEGWAQGRTSNLDWYENPVEEKVYR